MKIKLSLQKRTSVFSLTVLLLVSLACGTSSNVTESTIDPNLIQTAIVGTANAAELQTLTAGAPTNSLISTNTPEQTSSPIPTITITPTESSIPTLEEPTALPILKNGAMIRINVVNKQDEYVDLGNVGNQLQDLSGWSLVSEKGNQACNLGGVIMPGATLRVWANNPNGGGYNCSFGAAIWNNNELDPAVLYNDQGKEIARYP